MPTPIDRAMNSRNLFLGFAGIVTAVAAWGIWGQDLFPKEEDPKGEPETWSEDEMRRWLNSRNLMAGSTATREDLLARVRANMRAPRV
ncbi:ORF (Precursor) [Teratosphaeria destructans]|uniref:ORF (Precursor) n=1 Tax=Teratosphaeria destructans TaxID=418781 RepID=A0A9W7SZG8_9PEZI|nr:ORF (Precursor) [Teratosphaeria destructans]